MLSMVSVWLAQLHRLSSQPMLTEPKSRQVLQLSLSRFYQLTSTLRLQIFRTCTSTSKHHTALLPKASLCTPTSSPQSSIFRITSMVMMPRSTTISITYSITRQVRNPTYRRIFHSILVQYFFHHLMLTSLILY